MTGVSLHDDRSWSVEAYMKSLLGGERRPALLWLIYNWLMFLLAIPFHKLKQQQQQFMGKPTAAI